MQVLALRAILKDEVAKKQVSTGYTDISGEETVESTSIPSSDNQDPAAMTNLHQIAECNYPLNMEEFNMMPPYWPSCP